MKTFLVVLCSMLFQFSAVQAQKKIYKNTLQVPDITLNDFTPTVYALDSNAQAVILYDGGSARYVSDNSTWFNILYTYKKRIRLLNKNAFDEATVKIPLYKGETENDKLKEVKACTYNIVNGAIEKTVLDKSAVFLDKASKSYDIQKFTLPNLKEGCIIEYSYTIESPLSYSLRSWSFQTSYPVLKSEYDVLIPTLFNYIYLPTGYYNLKPTIEEGFEQFKIVDRGQTAFARTEIYYYDATMVHSTWVLKDLPALTKEPFTTALKNHRAAIEFQLKSLDYPNSESKPYLSNWNELVKTLLKDETFGADLDARNPWMSDEVKQLTVSNNTLNTTKNIYQYVRDNFTCTDHDAFYMSTNLKKVFETKKGNVAEINLILIAMLKKAGIDAVPLLLSTTDNGKAYDVYPLINKFNYVVAKVLINDKPFYLDASEKKIGFNHLPQACYNGNARTIADPPNLVSFAADSLLEQKQTVIFISNTEKQGVLEGYFKTNLGYYESVGLREKLISTTKEDYFKKISAGFSYPLQMKNTVIDSLNVLEAPLELSYEFNLDVNEDILYFNPLMGEGYKKNPFASTNRNFPIEMPFKSSETIVVNIEIPKGYKIDELPKSERVKFNENDGLFEYLVSADATNIYVKCRVDFSNTFMLAEDYQTLRDFYGHIVKKQAEQIVFKKIK
ncbi:transglutaminase domain-containing protein [Ferruginibacter yonginensis]|uniref:Transglutaminase domain-containing protein n=1 Tax=Ferruginibacter yonginensis TaxID=1310416 RepID=A0ABV8QRQ4_9BACT